MQRENFNDLLAFLALARNEASLRSGGPRVPELDWKSYRETGPDNTVSGSTTNGGSVLLGKMTVRRTLKSWTIIRGSKMKKNGMRPVPPGEILNEDVFETAGPHGKRALEGDRGAAQPDHGDSEG